MGKLTWPRIRRMLVFDWLWSTVGLIMSHGSWAVFDAMFVTLPVVLFLVAVVWPAYLRHVHTLVERDRAALVVRARPMSPRVARATALTVSGKSVPVRKLVNWREVARMELDVYGFTMAHRGSPYMAGLTALPSRQSGSEPLRPFPLDAGLEVRLGDYEKCRRDARTYLRRLADEDAKCGYEPRWPKEVHEYLLSRGVGFWHPEVSMAMYDAAYTETLTTGREQSGFDLWEEL